MHASAQPAASTNSSHRRSILFLAAEGASRDSSTVLDVPHDLTVVATHRDAGCRP
jgi:hypothetical protein